MKTLEEGLEVEAARIGDDDLPVDDERLGGQGRECRDELGEVPRERAVVSAAQVDGGPVPKREAPKAVPLRLVHEITGRQLAGEAREHRLDRWLRRVHEEVLPDARPGQTAQLVARRLMTSGTPRRGSALAHSPYRGGRTRTCNPRFWRPVLCQLSYAPRLRSNCTAVFLGQ